MAQGVTARSQLVFERWAVYACLNAGRARYGIHFENAILVARELAAAGIKTVRGDLHVGATFWRQRSVSITRALYSLS